MWQTVSTFTTLSLKQSQESFPFSVMPRRHSQIIARHRKKQCPRRLKSKQRIKGVKTAIRTIQSASIRAFEKLKKAQGSNLCPASSL